MARLPRKSVKKSKILLVALSIALFGGAAYIHAQSLSEAAQSHREKLLAELRELEQAMESVQSLIDNKRGEAASLERDIAIFDAQIKKAKLEIRAIDLTIQTLQGKISSKEETIDEIVAKVDREKLSLAESLRKLWELDDVSIFEAMLSHERISDYFGDIESVDIVQRSLQESFGELRSTKSKEEQARDEFVEQKTEASELRALQVIERKKVEKKEAERKELLRATKGQEAAYQKLLTAKRRDAASIRSQLFLLQGSPDIPFEKAVELAERASKKTGVRVAFILGIIAQESELGKNIGQCNLPNDPPRYKWQAIMKPGRDQKPYLEITSKLRLDPNLMPLSCPLSVGWGGAMGPAQFIPSTWLTLENRIASATGHNPPNPWNPEDAFMASAIFLSDLGASSPAREREAAARYFAGGNWKSRLGTTYANQVLAKVETYQNQIDIIKSVAVR
ncbi:MAG: Peptidase M23B [Parcubacteria group bacterium GW2011_GWA2_47_10b]|nr:MAG: Peptidase M23B [Parcubacteria group bacterium GW2011_GWA2_47_10b]KKU85431.1 MAG: Peptidase M23B [Parcubacteria group bacterium GW2011_GWA1_47_9]